MTKLKQRALVTGIVLAVTSGICFAAAGDPVIGKTLAESKPGTAPVLPVAEGAPNVI